MAIKINLPTDEDIPEIELIHYRFRKAIGLSGISLDTENTISFIRNLRKHWIFLKRKYPQKENSYAKIRLEH